MGLDARRLLRAQGLDLLGASAVLLDDLLRVEAGQEVLVVCVDQLGRLEVLIECGLKLIVRQIAQLL